MWLRSALPAAYSVGLACEDHLRCQSPRGVVFITRGPSRQVRSTMAHLQAGGVRHVTEVRVITDRGSAQGCQRDRRMHQFVEEILNGSVLPQAPLPWCWYRCVDFVNLPEGSGGSRVGDLTQDLSSQGVEFVATVPDAFEDLVRLSDQISAHLGAAMANDPRTTGDRVNKARMQEALGPRGARQAMVSSVDEVPRALEELGAQLGGQLGPVIVKPAESAASDGVFLCQNEQAVLAAVQEDLQGTDIYQRPNQEIVIQEYFEGREFVVNTVSLHGHHRVVDMWRAVKKKAEGRILYGHQELVQDTRDHDDVVSFCLSVLDAVGLSNGTAHLEVIDTEIGCRLIEINPRSAGHEPRATRVLKEHQQSVLAGAICKPEEFLLRVARSGPHYGEAGDAVCVAFLAAEGDAEVPRERLLEIVALPSFERFDRVQVSGFAELLEQSPPDAFWVCGRTEGLFTAPLVVVLRGAPERVRRDLERLRLLEGRLYRPFGTHDAGGYAGALEGGDASLWFSEALGRAACPGEGARLQALPGAHFQGTDGRTDHYVAGDTGTVTRVTKDRFVIKWQRTGLATSIGKLSWHRYFKVASSPATEVVGTAADAQA